MSTQATHLTRAEINLNHLSHNMELLQDLVGSRPMWPVIKLGTINYEVVTSIAQRVKRIVVKGQ